MHAGIEDADLRVVLEVGCGNFAFALFFDVDGLRTLSIELCGKSLEIQNNFAYILFDTGDCTQFMVYTINFHRIHSHTGQ